MRRDLKGWSIRESNSKCPINSVPSIVWLLVKGSWNKEVLAVVSSYSENSFDWSNLLVIYPDQILTARSFFRYFESKAYCWILCFSGSVIDDIVWLIMYFHEECELEVVIRENILLDDCVVESIKQHNFNEHNVIRSIDYFVSDNMSFNSILLIEDWSIRLFNSV